MNMYHVYSHFLKQSFLVLEEARDIALSGMYINKNPGNIATSKTDLSRLMTKPTKWSLHPAKTELPVWSEFSLSAWRKLGSIATQKAHSAHAILLVVSWGSSFSIWAGARQNLRNDLRAKRTFRSVWSSGQFDLSLASLGTKDGALRFNNATFWIQELWAKEGLAGRQDSY